MSERTLVKLGRRYPGTSRMTRWRWRRDPDFPDPVVINGTEYYDTDELSQYEEAHRRRRPRQMAEETRIDAGLVPTISKNID